MLANYKIEQARKLLTLQASYGTNFSWLVLDGKTLISLPLTGAFEHKESVVLLNQKEKNYKFVLCARGLIYQEEANLRYCHGIDSDIVTDMLSSFYAKKVANVEEDDSPTWFFFFSSERKTWIHVEIDNDYSDTRYVLSTLKTKKQRDTYGKVLSAIPKRYLNKAALKILSVLQGKSSYGYSS